MSIDEIDRKIEVERAATDKAITRKTELETKRAAALVEGDDSQVDHIDAEIRSASIAITRGIERIELLQQKRTDAIATQRETELDDLAAQTNQARIEGEVLIRDYAKHAAAIAPILLKLKTLDLQVDDANRRLQADGRNQVSTSNAIRCRPMSFVNRTVRRVVGIGELEHPMNKVHFFDRNGNCRHRQTGEPIEQFGEFDVIEKKHELGVFAEPLYDSVQLPSIEPGGSNFWPNPSAKSDEIKPSLVDRILNPIRGKAA